MALAVLAGCAGLGWNLAGAEGAAPAPPHWDGDLPDPAVVADAGGYLAFGTSTAGLHVPVARSAGLTGWTLVGDALPSLPGWARADRPVWAPGVASIGGRWRLFSSVVEARTGWRCISVATADEASGPYVDPSAAPLLCDDERAGVIDPDPFIAEDGTPWLLWKSEGIPGDHEAALWSQRLTDDASALVGPRHLLLERQRPWEWPVIENPTMTRWRGGHVLLYSTGLWATEGYQVGAATCAGPAGPCRRMADRALLGSTSQLAGPGGQSFFRDRSGRPWIALHGWAPGQVGYRAGGARRIHVTRLEGTLADIRVDGRPVGRLDQVTPAPGGLRVRGWAVDPDTDAATDVHLFVDGRPVTTVPAGARRPDVATALGTVGPDHGLDARIAVGPGAHSVCAVAGNVGLGADHLIGCLAAWRGADPMGRFDAVGRPHPGRLVVRGWALDPDIDGPIAVHLVLDGRPVMAVLANVRRADLAALGFGTDHGVEAAVAVGPGPHTLCLHAINAEHGSNQLLGCARG